MKRSSFFKLFLAAGSVVSSPFSSFAKKDIKRVGKGFKVDAGKDRFDKSISLFEGDTFYTKVATEDTDGDIFVFESSRLKEGGPGLHFHFDQDEWWYVLQGEFLIKVGETTYRAKAGDSVFGPRKIAHAFAKVGEGEGKLLMFFQPAGKMEDFFKKISEGVTKSMSEEEKDKFWGDHGIKRVGPPLKNLKM
ncbi:cupin domain-containing protein [Ginsengibacter hankyongi]|uniref:Cupin domain-containing protein n=1 Tax=Ginsengibacter hankyongi TaxID=2607284 RepID=A0A5J5IEP4_9BACT|nr:cupin domain-containing protein [Ginsengibacter hankyongi]KAA9038373.1 cupin domain-containing protein [Ginsengibacter hankyongi]